MFTITAPVTFEIPREDIADMLDTAGYSISGWATQAAIREETYVVHTDAYDDEMTVHTATYEQLAQALVRIGTSGEFEGYYVAQYAKDYLFTQDAGNIDGELADMVVQLALFGEIVFG